MVCHIKKKSQDHETLTPSYGGRALNQTIPKFKIPETEMPAIDAYRLIHDELMLDGNSRLNLATFVTTWMEPEAQALMSETFDKNMIDKDEYPQTAKIEERCINIISKLFNAPETGVGTSAIGSSEAVMLAGMAFKWKWRARREREGKPTTKPNLVLGSNVQVVWEKFCRYWEVEPRYVPMEKGQYTIHADGVLEQVDENTIGVVAILGTTYTGQFEPIQEVHDALMANNQAKGLKTMLHVDAASGGFVAPFLHPDLPWDFRLPLVKSINVSGHKYGLVYPGIGWVIWRDREALPEELIFHVNYLGGDMPTFTLNFSRPGNQVVAQYYNFLRLGFSGYQKIMQSLSHTAQYIAQNLEKTGPFEMLHDGRDTPVIAFRVTTDDFTCFNLSDALRVYGWQVPAYTMPKNIQDLAVLRIVIREGFSRDMADSLLADFQRAVKRCREGVKVSKTMFVH